MCAPSGLWGGGPVPVWLCPTFHLPEKASLQPGTSLIYPFWVLSCDGVHFNRNGKFQKDCRNCFHARFPHPDLTLNKRGSNWGEQKGYHLNYYVTGSAVHCWHYGHQIVRRCRHMIEPFDTCCYRPSVPWSRSFFFTSPSCWVSQNLDPSTSISRKKFCGSESEEHHYRIPRAVLSTVSVFIWMEAYQPTPTAARKPSSRRPQAKLLCYFNGFLFRPISRSSSPFRDLWEISVRSRQKDVYNVFTMSSQ